MDVGTVIDERYRVLRRLGEGAFGEVLEVEDQNLGRLVALKLLKVSVADEQLRARFDREARVTAGLAHPHVVTLYGHGLTAEGRPYLAYELLEGQDLESRRRRGEVCEEDALRWGVEVAQALQVAHERGVVHRDVKPANVFLKRGEVAVLCDFGIAREGAGDSSLTSEGVLLGTPAYMSPELWRGSSPSAASDQWAWAASLFELVYARTPYPGQTPQAIMEQALDSRVVQVPAGFQGRRPGLEAVLLRGLAVRPEDRYPDMAAFAAALQEAARGSLQDVLERSGIGLVPRPGVDSMIDSPRATRVLPPGADAGAGQAAAAARAPDVEPTPTRHRAEPTRIPRWVLVAGAAAFMTLGIYWPRDRSPPPEPPPRPPSSEAEASPKPATAPPAVLARLAPLRRDLLMASRELRRLMGYHPSEAPPDRLVRLTFQPTERLEAIDPPEVGRAVLATDTRHHLWRDFLAAAQAWLQALAREQRASEVDLLEDPGIVASLDTLIYQPALRLLECAHLYYWWEARPPGLMSPFARENFRKLGPPYQELMAEVHEGWGSRDLPEAMVNLDDIGKVLGHILWHLESSWDSSDRRQLLYRLQERVGRASPNPIGAIPLRLAMYHLCFTAWEMDASWRDRDALLTALAAKLIDDPAWQPPAFDAGTYRLLLGRLVVEEVRQRRVHDAPTKLEEHPERRTARVLDAFEGRWEEDPMLAFHVAAAAWDLGRYAGAYGYFNSENHPVARPMVRRLEAIRNAAHRRAKPGTDLRGVKREG